MNLLLFIENSNIVMEKNMKENFKMMYMKDKVIYISMIKYIKDYLVMGN